MENKLEKICSVICSICIVALTVLIVIETFKPKYNVYDVNHDGKVNSLDLLKVQKYILEQNNNN